MLGVMITRYILRTLQTIGIIACGCGILLMVGGEINPTYKTEALLLVNGLVLGGALVTILTGIGARRCLDWETCYGL